MKIKLILTGGTIGSMVREKDKLADVTANSVYLLVKAYEEKYGKDVCFETETVLRSLSENFNPDMWEILCRAVSRVVSQGYDGIIIAHGTDTLSYSSALLSILFAGCQVPIVCIASNYPIGMEKSNGLDNLRSAIVFLKRKYKEGIKGVYTIFQNRSHENILYDASRLMEADLALDEFSSFGGEILGKVFFERTQERVELYKKNMDRYFTFQKKCVQHQRVRELAGTITFKNKVQIIVSYPGLDYDLLAEAFCCGEQEKRPKAVLVRLYHSATACVKENSYSILPFLTKCQENGMDVYVTSFKENAQTTYVTTQKMVEAGAIPLYQMSLELSYAKLCCAYNQNIMTPAEFMRE